MRGPTAWMGHRGCAEIPGSHCNALDLADTGRPEATVREGADPKCHVDVVFGEPEITVGQY